MSIYTGCEEREEAAYQRGFSEAMEFAAKLCEGLASKLYDHAKPPFEKCAKEIRAKCPINPTAPDGKWRCAACGAKALENHAAECPRYQLEVEWADRGK